VIKVNTQYNIQDKGKEKVVPISSATSYNEKREVNEYNKSQTFIRSDNMDDDKILEMYIKKVDQDQAELKQDIRESEKRLENHIIASEKRMDEKIDRIENLIVSQNEKFEKFDDKISQVSKEVSNKLGDHKKFLWGITISIFLAVAAMVVTLIVAVTMGN